MQGIVYAFKTDTVWGFGAHPEDDIAINKIYKIKKRDRKKPLILMSDDFKPLKRYIKNVPDYAYDLIKKHLPGGLTLIFEKSEYCSALITPFNTVGVRIPKSIDFFNLVKKVEGRVLATTSCNVSGQNPVLNYNEAKDKFKNTATIIKPYEDNITNSLPSTVIICENNNYKILREGAVKL